MTTRLIIDTDTAQDDAFAILIGLLHPNAQLEAITINYGNIDFDQMVENALYTVEVAGRSGQVPVYKGATHPLLAPFDDAKYVHGEDGFGGANFPIARQRPETENAVSALIRMINENPGELTILAIAPLTNIACAVAADRSIAHKVKELIIMGGTNNGLGNVTAAAEANFFHDPEAARIVFEAGFPITLCTWTLTRDVIFDEAKLQQISNLNTPLSKFFDQANSGTLNYNRTVIGLNGSTHPDSIAAAIAVDSSIVAEANDRYVAIQDGNGLTAGYSLVDSVNRSGKAPNARVIESIDVDAFFKLMLSTLS